MIFRYRFAGKISKNNLIRQKNLPATQFLQADHYFFVPLAPQIFAISVLTL